MIRSAHIGHSNSFLHIVKHLILLALLFHPCGVSAQDDRYFSFELAGSGGFGSFNYEKCFYQNKSLDLFLRTGISLEPFGSNSGVILVFPIMVHATLGNETHKLDFGIGQAPSATIPIDGVFIRMPLSLGYKHMSADKSHYWRVSYTPIVSYLVQFQWEHWAGITYGRALKPSKK